MFTGLVAEIGVVESAERDADGARLRVASPLAAELAPGASIAVNGACLTAASTAAEAFEAEAMNQTLSLTTLGELGPGSRVNLEPALRAGDPLGGHIVQGHVDGTAELEEVVPDGFARRLRLRIDEGLGRYVVEHGSVALDGVSLTVSALGERGFEVSLIPETLERTTLADRRPGDRLNLEVDLLARYAERLLQGLTERSPR